MTRGPTVTQDILTDVQIEALTAAQRRELIQRLERPMAELKPRSYAERLRQAHLGLMTGGALFMIPWIVYLALTLPQNYTVHDWPLTWVGFDILLVAFMAATAILTWLHRQVVVLPAFTTGILLVCDAWFDVTTASSGELRLTRTQLVEPDGVEVGHHLAHRGVRLRARLLAGIGRRGGLRCRG